jgi:Fur family zinc uptake transcriptional regulator
VQLDEAADLCSRHSVHLTDLRRIVLGLILQANRPLTAYQLLDQLKATRPGAAPPTIYRALEFLLEQKLIHKLERSNAFIACTGLGQHAHAAQLLVCGTCGQAAELEDRSVARALWQAAAEIGFRPSNRIVEIDGICADCARLKSSSGVDETQF